jgi:hypothetical protein
LFGKSVNDVGVGQAHFAHPAAAKMTRRRRALFMSKQETS